ncbi:MAG: DNA-binding response regulator [Methylocystaceae bacterium]|nr:DNA-binding response regulator [Methylocystaceae bacterium]
MIRKTRILVVDDERQIQRFLSPSLKMEGYDVVLAGNAAEAMEMMVRENPDLVVLDLGLPDRDGKSVISDIRSRSPVPILILSARDEESEKIAALDMGANDFIVKPFSVGELLARVRAALRLQSGQDQERRFFQFDDLTIDVEHYLVKRDGRDINLTPKEFELLHVLARHAGRVLTHGFLLNAIWGPAHTNDTQYLRVFIGQLRQKVEHNPSEPTLILTQPGVGYRLAEPHPNE